MGTDTKDRELGEVEPGTLGTESGWTLTGSRLTYDAIVEGVQAAVEYGTRPEPRKDGDMGEWVVVMERLPAEAERVGDSRLGFAGLVVRWGVVGGHPETLAEVREAYAWPGVRFVPMRLAERGMLYAGEVVAQLAASQAAHASSEPPKVVDAARDLCSGPYRYEDRDEVVVRGEKWRALLKALDDAEK